MKYYLNFLCDFPDITQTDTELIVARTVLSVLSRHFFGAERFELGETFF
jgi:hypothetical protein